MRQPVVRVRNGRTSRPRWGSCGWRSCGAARAGPDLSERRRVSSVKRTEATAGREQQVVDEE